MKKSLSILIISTFLFVANLSFAQTSDETILVQLNNIQIKEIKQNSEEDILATLIVTKFSSGFKCSYFPSEESEKSRPCSLKLRRNILKALRKGLKINILEETELLDINRENIKLQDLQVGNKINVYGELNKQSYEIDALIVRKIGEGKIIPPPVAGVIKVLSPNGGEKWQLGDTHTILWTPYDPTSGINPVTQVTAYLEKLVNGNFVSVGEIIECGKASIHWKGNLDTCGSNSYAEPGDYYIRVVNNVTGASDRSDRPFTLVPERTIKVDLKINGSDGPIIVPKGGATYTISWTSNAEECNIYGPRDFRQLNVSSSGSILMNLLDTDAYFYPDRVSIVCNSKKPIEGSAYDYVELSPFLTVLFPNGGETIDFNDYSKILWKAPPNVTKVSIALYRNDAFYTWIVKDLPTMNAMYDFNGYYYHYWVPSNTGISDNDFGKNIFKIYILGYKSEGGTVEDKSDAPFNIK
jgi:hypothetical protein